MSAVVALQQGELLKHHRANTLDRAGQLLGLRALAVLEQLSYALELAFLCGSVNRLEPVGHHGRYSWPAVVPGTSETHDDLTGLEFDHHVGVGQAFAAQALQKVPSALQLKAAHGEEGDDHVLGFCLGHVNTSRKPLLAARLGIESRPQAGRHAFQRCRSVLHAIGLPATAGIVSFAGETGQAGSSGQGPTPAM